MLDAPCREHRETLYAALTVHLRLTQGIIPAGRAWINGSFCTSREAPPNDVDVVLHPADWTTIERLPEQAKSRLYALLTLRDVAVAEPAIWLSRLQPVGGVIDAFRAMALAMLLGGLRSAEVRGLMLADADMGRRRLRVTGKERHVPVDQAFFTELAAYLRLERPRGLATSECFVVLRGPTTGGPVTEAGLRSLFRRHRQVSGRPGFARIGCVTPPGPSSKGAELHQVHHSPEGVRTVP